MSAIEKLKLLNTIEMAKRLSEIEEKTPTK